MVTTPRAKRAGARRTLLSLTLVGAVLSPSAMRAQNIVSVPFTNGFIDTRGSNPQDAQNVRTFATLGIARIFFIQNSSTNQFQIQGTTFRARSASCA